GGGGPSSRPLAAPRRRALSGGPRTRLDRGERSRRRARADRGARYPRGPGGGDAGGARCPGARSRRPHDPLVPARALGVAELGLPGLAALLALLVGVAAAARCAYRREPGLTAGWIAALCVWAVHAGLDWDWEMPAVTLIAIALAGALLARADVPADGPDAGQ